MAKFWNFKNVSEMEGELLLYGTIAESSWWDDVVSSKQFNADLRALGDVSHIMVRINSGGGDVFAGHAIYQQLKDHSAKITTKIEGLAASAAGVVFMAGDERIAPVGSFFMAHNPASIARGEAKDFTKMADTLKTIKDGIINIFVEATGKDKNEISKLMDNETWMTGEDAVREGFATKTSSEDSTIAEPVLNGKLLILNNVSHDISKFKTIPNVNQFIPSAPQANAPEPPPVANKSSEKEGEKPMFKDIAELRNACPELVKQIEDAAREDGKKQERARIQDIEKIANNIEPDLVAKAKFEEPVDAKDLAFQAMQKDNGKGQQHLKDLETDATNSGANNVLGSPLTQQTDAEKKEAENKAVDSITAGGNKRRGK